jgi:hypothetical protein
VGGDFRYDRACIIGWWRLPLAELVGACGRSLSHLMFISITIVGVCRIVSLVGM